MLAEHPMGCRASRAHFIKRNRIIAALAWATVVVEGRRGSGSLETAHQAVRYGRELLAVPGPADSPLSEAPHTLLRQGARLAATARDVVAALPEGAALKAPGPARSPALALEGEERVIMEALGGDALSLDELSRLTSLDTARLSLIMFALEIKDLVSSVPGQRYAKKSRG